MIDDYYSALISERGDSEAAVSLADSCRLAFSVMEGSEG